MPGWNMREALQRYVKRVQELAEHVRGNEQATKQSLVGPLFTLLGYDLTDPRECVPEYRVDFGPNRSVKPIDWAFFQAARPIFGLWKQRKSAKSWATTTSNWLITSPRPPRQDWEF